MCEDLLLGYKMLVKKNEDLGVRLIEICSRLNTRQVDGALQSMREANEVKLQSSNLIGNINKVDLDKVLSENGEVKMQIIALESAIDNMKFTLAKFEDLRELKTSYRDLLPKMSSSKTGEAQKSSLEDYQTEAIELDPADSTLYSNRSFCHLRLGDAGDALCDANSCIRLRPEWHKGYYRKGAALMVLKEYEGASDAFMAGLQLDPTNLEMRKAYWEASDAMMMESCDLSSLD